MRYLTMAAAVLLSICLSSSIGFARSASLVGTWAGGGKVYPKNGAAERVRCRVWVNRAGRGYNASSTCHSSIGKAEPTAYLTKRGNVYSGKFRDAQNNTSGWIRFRLNGRRLSVSLGSSDGRASLSLRRR